MQQCAKGDIQSVVGRMRREFEGPKLVELLHSKPEERRKAGGVIPRSLNRGQGVSRGRKPLADLFYVFCDEQRHETDSKTRFSTGHVAIPQATWNRLSKDRRGITKPGNVPRLSRIQKLLDDVNGIAVITFADIPTKYLPQGERDSTADIENMSRTDHIWSVTMGFGVVATLKWLTLHGSNIATVDGYHDTKSLRHSHREALNIAITQQIAKSIREVSTDKLRVRRFCDIPKAKGSDQPNKFQEGIAVADRLLRYPPTITETLDDRRIHYRDHSAHVVSYIRDNFTCPP